MVEESTSNTRFKLNEAAYFLEQMKNNIDNKTHFIFNLIAFVCAGRSVTFVMQKQYKVSEDEEDPFWSWYVPNVQEALKNDEDAVFFDSLRIKFVHQEGNPRPDIFLPVYSTLRVRYDITGSATEREEEEEAEKDNSKRESSPQTAPTISDNPDAQESPQKYIWYIKGVNDEMKKSRKYVIPSCEDYLQRLKSIVDDCETRFSRTTGNSIK